MKLLVIVLCLLSERYLIHTLSYNRFGWFNNYAKKITEQTFVANIKSIPWLPFLLLLLPLILITALIYWLLHNWLYGFLELLFNIVIFYYCIGPENPFYPMNTEEDSSDTDEQIGNYFYAVNRQLFAPLFWYIATGPFGLLIYRLITLSQTINPVSQEATLLTNILEWPAARMSALLWLLVGNFQQGFLLLKQLFFTGITTNKYLLRTCGLEALRTTTQETISVPLAENLVEQSVIVLLVILALCTAVAWL